MKFKVRFKSVLINQREYELKLDDYLRKELKRAGTVWLNATVLLAIPVWSGASHGTFLKLARELNFPLAISNVTENGKRRGGGVRYGFNKSKGEVSLGKKRGQYTFKYETDLFHLVFNESQNANQNPAAGRLFSKLIEPGPYNFQKIGQAAFEDFSQLIELPSPWTKARLKIRSIRVG
jgi:hypothetical protein